MAYPSKFLSIKGCFQRRILSTRLQETSEEYPHCDKLRDLQSEKFHMYRLIWVYHVHQQRVASNMRGMTPISSPTLTFGGHKLV
jgi:hypothetical protein